PQAANESLRRRSQKRIAPRIDSVRAVAQERGSGASKRGRLAAIKTFFRDAWLELQKVNWPTQEDVAKMTGLVVAVVVIVGAFVFVWENILAALFLRLLK
ncbi:MAG: preprotein translocase subunit SecE, partial [Armatimonadetes bacterium]|nr:preprotein translocase subunit SecE [Armatimonadota bacterium]